MKHLLICVGLFLYITSNPLSAQTNLEIPISKNGDKDVVLKRTGYTVSFSKENNIPNWVAWKLDKNRLVEKVSRKGYRFNPDPNINERDAVITQDYANSGYDRGHMCPAGDSRWSGQTMK